MATRLTRGTQLVRWSAQLQRGQRQLVLAQLFGTLGAAGGQPQPLVQLANTFSRYAQTQSTAFEGGGARSSGGGGTGTVLERQVDRAIGQVLGRGTGRDASSFMSALNGAFPVATDGQVQFTPARSAVSLYSPDANGTASGASRNALAAGLSGQISAEQATLYQQASTISKDALGILAGLQPFVPEAEPDKVDALRALVRSEITTLVEEFGRTDEPRAERVDRYFTALTGHNGHLIEFGRRAFLERRLVTPATASDESMVAGFELVTRYVQSMRAAWNDYNQPGRSLRFPVFTQRLQRASVLLSVIGDGVTNLLSAMDSIGFTDSERRSRAASFKTLGPNLPDITVADYADDVDALANINGPTYLADSGQYGLGLVTHEAHNLFNILGVVLPQVRAGGVAILSTLPPVAQVLTHDRVSWALDDLLGQLNELANQAA
jgi:hypothetical protein